MRLLYRNSDGQYAFKEVADAKDERYAILSHRWYPEGEDVLFADVVNQNKKDVMSKSGWRKVNYALNQASADEINYVWIDTCCIDKTSSAELSEAINSMFFWYREARVCYAYLWDISNDWSIRETAESDEAAQKRFNAVIVCSSEWLRRGWTLQELIAPREVKFFDGQWRFQGSANDFVKVLEWRTGIPEKLLDGTQPLHNFSIAQRMSWAADRRTTRIEDQAYSLLGIFDVNMPLLYGERHKAFTRLQEEILRQNPDDSIFAWSFPSHTDPYPGHLFAPSPSAFADCGDIRARRIFYPCPPPFRMNTTGLQGRFPLVRTRDGLLLLQLDCYGSQSDHLGIVVAPIDGLEQIPSEDATDFPIAVARTHQGRGRVRSVGFGTAADYRHVFVAKSMEQYPYYWGPPMIAIHGNPETLILEKVYPLPTTTPVSAWSPSHPVCTLMGDNRRVALQLRFPQSNETIFVAFLVNIIECRDPVPTFLGWIWIRSGQDTSRAQAFVNADDKDFWLPKPHWFKLSEPRRYIYNHDRGALCVEVGMPPHKDSLQRDEPLLRISIELVPEYLIMDELSREDSELYEILY